MSTEVTAAPAALDGLEGRPFIVCHRSWVVGVQPTETPSQMVKGRLIPGQTVLMPAPGMMPCLSSQCMMWDAYRGQCIERTVAETQIGHRVRRTERPEDGDGELAVHQLPGQEAPAEAPAEAPPET